MKLVGYSDRWSVATGETIRFYVSAAADRFHARVARLIHGDDNPRGPGYKARPVISTIEGSYKGGVQAINSGSYVRIDSASFLAQATRFTLCAWVRATLPRGRDQGIVTQWNSGARRGVGLYLNGATGKLEGRMALANGNIVTISSERELRSNEWYFAALAVDLTAGSLRLRTDICRPSAFDAKREIKVHESGTAAALDAAAPLLLAAGHLVEEDGRVYATHCFNGKLSSPFVLKGALSFAELEKHEADEFYSRSDQMLARWDLFFDPSQRRIPDLQSHDGVTVNRPTRAVTGHNWRARTDAFTEAPLEYNAIHFHDDDLEDAGWVESFRMTVPRDMGSGVYAIELSDDNGEIDQIPFFVRPPVGEPSAPIAVLIPTLSYMAYSNESMNPELMDSLASLCPLRNMQSQAAEYDYIGQAGLKSTYDHHRDGSGVCHVTILRPSLTSMRPKHRCRLFDGPHQLSADLHLIDWLEEKQIPYDIITDHDLHREGVDLLLPYKTILTGTHAEYWTVAMLDALESYQGRGGRVIYLSGNGLYWVTALDPETQTVCEVRRPHGTRAWHAQPGEGRLSFSGEPGGLWSWRGRAPQRYVGIGFSSEGFDRGVPFRRTPSSNDPRCSFLFEGIVNEVIGNFPSLVMNHGAAGFELDRTDAALGTPPHVLVVASSARLSDSYQVAVEDVPVMMPYQGGLTNSNVRADMVFFETPGGGAVFSVGSISFCSALSFNGYQNDISRLLENAVKRFANPMPF
jgi:N,N-dimethylformamidase